MDGYISIDHQLKKKQKKQGMGTTTEIRVRSDEVRVGSEKEYRNGWLSIGQQER